MTHNENYDKLRAVFLTALMIGSVFAAGIAFSGSAAAGSLGVTLANDEVGETTTYTANYEVGSGISDVATKTIKFGTDSADISSVSKEDVTVTIRGDEATVGSISTSNGLEITLDSSVSVSSGDSVTVQVANVVNPATTDSQTASVSLHGSGGSTIDSAQAGFSAADSVPAISEFSAEADGSTVNVSFVASQELDNGTDGNISVALSPSGSETTTWFNSSNYEGKKLDNGDFLYYQEQSIATDGAYTATLVKAIDADTKKQDAASGETASVTVDTSAPEFDELEPAEGADLTAVPDTIRVQVNDSLSQIDRESISVTLRSDGGSYTFVDNVDVTKENDGISFAYADGDQTTGNVTIVPDQLPVKSFPDGEIQVEISASDAAGNSNATSSNFDTAEGTWTGYDFQLDTGANFEFTLETPGDTLTNDANQNIIVGHSGEGTTFDYANLTIANASDSWSFTSDSDGLDAANGDVYNATSNTFNLSAGDGNGNLPALADGSYTITVNATDTFGNTAEDTTYAIEVDTQNPKVDDVSISGAGADGIFNNEEAETAQIDVAFNESVQSATVDVDIDGDGTADKSITLNYNDDATAATAEVDLTTLTSVDVEDASVNVTSVTDVAGNTNSTEVSTVFAVDTKTTTHTNGITGALDAYEDLTQHVSGLPDDAASVTYHIKPEGTSSYSEITDPEHFDPSQYDDDVYTVAVNVTDDAGNTVSVTTNPYVDLESPSVTTSFEDGQVVSGTITLGEAFSVQNNDSSVSWTFDVDTNNDGTFDATGVSDPYSVPSSTNGQTIKVKATASEDAGAGEDATKTVTLVADDVEVTGTSLTQKGENLQATVTIDEKVDTLEVSVNSIDSFRSQVSKDLTLTEFGSPEKTNSDNWKYTYNVSDVRDGQYELNVTAAANGSRSTITGLSSPEVSGVTLDNGNATLVNAHITGYDGTDTTVELRFDEPVDSGISTGDVSFEGANANSVTRQSETGTVTATLSGALQTGDAPDINTSAVTEAYGGEDGASSTTLHTIELSLDKGTNFVSIPAEAGKVEVSELNLPEGSTIMTYEDGSWDTFVQSGTATDDDFTEIHPGKGYIVNVDGAGYTVDLNVYNVPAQLDSQTELPSEDVESGWNLLGHYQEGQQQANSALSTVEDSTTNVETIYGLSGDGFNYNALDKSADNFVPGEAYWVFVDDPDDDDTYAPTGL